MSIGNGKRWEGEGRKGGRIQFKKEKEKHYISDYLYIY